MTDSARPPGYYPPKAAPIDPLAPPHDPLEDTMLMGAGDGPYLGGITSVTNAAASSPGGHAMPYDIGPALLQQLKQLNVHLEVDLESIKQAMGFLQQPVDVSSWWPHYKPKKLKTLPPSSYGPVQSKYKKKKY